MTATQYMDVKMRNGFTSLRAIVDNHTESFFQALLSRRPAQPRVRDVRAPSDPPARLPQFLESLVWE